MICKELPKHLKQELQKIGLINKSVNLASDAGIANCSRYKKLKKEENTMNKINKFIWGLF